MVPEHLGSDIYIVHGYIVNEVGTDIQVPGYIGFQHTCIGYEYLSLRIFRFLFI